MKQQNVLVARAQAEDTTPLALIISAVENTGTLRAAARELGVSITTLRYWIKKSGLRPVARTALKGKS